VFQCRDPFLSLEPPGLMPLRLSAYLLHQQLDLGDFLVQASQVLGQGATDLAQGGHRSCPG